MKDHNSEQEKELLKSTAPTDVERVAKPQEDAFDILSKETGEAYRELQVVRDDEENAADPSQKKNPDGKQPVKVFCHQCQQKLDVTKLRPFSMIRCPHCGEKLLVPRWFDSYLLEEPGGSGGMAQVYRALDITLDREVAIKILKDGIRHDSVQAARFLHEARMAAVLNHTNVIPIYTCGVFEGQTYLVMQYMSGGSLESKLPAVAGKEDHLQEILRWFHDTAEGLEHAANNNIIHHDVKPGNILMDQEGNVKIGDFGLAQSASDQSDDSEIPEEEWVTPHYVSPERISSGKEDYRGDIYSLGATFYHLLTGVPPFDHENLEELIWMRTRQKPVSPAVLRPEIPRNIAALLMRMLNVDPATRPSYGQIISELDSVLSDTKNGSLVLQRDFPLPISPEEGNSFREERPTPSSIYRIKSPSAVLKNRPAPSRILDGNALNNENPAGKSLPGITGNFLQKFRKRSGYKDDPEKIPLCLLCIMIFFSVLTLAFLMYAAMEFLQAGL